MAGVLTFTLGLEASKFLDTLNISRGAVLGITGACEGLGKVMERVWGQVEKGGALNDLSKRTGESVENLFKLQKGFTAVGLSAENVGQSIFMMNKSLGGVNEMGEDTSSIFAKAGLSVEELKKKGGAGAMQDILGKMAGMNQTSATAFGGKIFGRGGAGDMVQASRQMKDFNDAMAGARAQAQVFQRVAAMFDEIDKAVGKVKAKLDPLFLVVAEKLAPVVKDLLDRINAFDTGPMVAQLGKFLEALKRSFGGTEFSELLMLSLQTGFEQGLYYGSKFTATLGMGLAAAIPAAVAAGLKASGVLLSSFGEKLYNLQDNHRIQQLKAEIRDIEQGKGLWSLSPDKVRKTRIAERQKQIEELETGQNDLRAGGIAQRRDLVTGAAKDIVAAMKAGQKAGGETWSGFGPAPTEGSNELKKRIKAVLNRTYLEPIGKGDARAALENVDFGKKPKEAKDEGEKVKASDLERMGFVFGGGTSASAMETTAKNTTSLVSLARDTLKVLSGLPFLPL